MARRLNKDTVNLFMDLLSLYVEFSHYRSIQTSYFTLKYLILLSNPKCVIHFLLEFDFRSNTTLGSRFTHPSNNKCNK
jgi:hypothetical protein